MTGERGSEILGFLCVGSAQSSCPACRGDMTPAAGKGSAGRKEGTAEWCGTAVEQ